MQFGRTSRKINIFHDAFVSERSKIKKVSESVILLTINALKNIILS
jgi:hypothetical protein